MELRHLRYFVAVAEELHFSRAAERLHVSQPPLSQQIKQLEEEVKVRLCDRTKRWVRLTGAGRLFLEDARRVLSEIDSAVLAARRTIEGECDRLSVACTPWAGFMGVPHILRRFREQHPYVRIEIQTLKSAQQLRAVKARVIDVAFMCRSSTDEDLHSDGLLAYPVVVALPFKHRLAARAHLSPRDLSGESYVTLAADVAPVYAEVAAGYWEAAGVAMKEQHKADQPHVVIDLVAAGAGFALVPLSVQEYAKERIVCRRLDPAPPQLELTLARARGVEPPAINALVEAARQIAGQQQALLAGEGRADSHPGLGVAMLSRAGEAGQARTNGAHQPGSSLLCAPLMTRDGGGKSIRTNQTRDVRVAGIVKANDRRSGSRMSLRDVGAEAAQTTRVEPKSGPVEALRRNPSNAAKILVAR